MQRLNHTHVAMNAATRRGQAAQERLLAGLFVYTTVYKVTSALNLFFAVHRIVTIFLMV
jgi:hypothetical protein